MKIFPPQTFEYLREQYRGWLDIKRNVLGTRARAHDYVPCRGMRSRCCERSSAGIKSEYTRPRGNGDGGKGEGEGGCDGAY